jgi:hypothetical protein
VIKKEVLEKMTKDVSKKTVLVILLIAIVISVVGTWTVLDAASTVKIEQPPAHEGGKVTLVIGDPGSVAPMSTGAVVALTIT